MMITEYSCFPQAIGKTGGTWTGNGLLRINFAPRGWALCEGQLLSISSNTALFSILGTTYGGDGRTTFRLPDLRGSVPISPGNGPGLPSYSLGQRGGRTTEILTTQQVPSHNHNVQMSDLSIAVNTNSDEITSASPESAHLSAQEDDHYASESSPGASMEISLAGSNVTVNPTGGSRAHNNMQPYLATNYIIALFGTYPSRN